MLRQTQDNEEIIERVAAVDKGRGRQRSVRELTGCCECAGLEAVLPTLCSRTGHCTRAVSQARGWRSHAGGRDVVQQAGRRELDKAGLAGALSPPD